MKTYYVNTNAQANGDHEVHEKGCVFMPHAPLLLGEFSSCHGAVAKAKMIYPKANGCNTCSRPCHTS